MEELFPTLRPSRRRFLGVGRFMLHNLAWLETKRYPPHLATDTGGGHVARPLDGMPECYRAHGLGAMLRLQRCRAVRTRLVCVIFPDGMIRHRESAREGNMARRPRR